MIRQAFQHRSGRVIALGRVVLSVFFAFAIWLDPARSAEADDRTFLLILGYTLFADLVLLATWNRWWLETWLSIAAHAIDLLVFTALVLLTEGYISPFFTFFVFLVLSASIRWGWRGALLTTALVIILFLAAVFAVTNSLGPGSIEVHRLVARAGNLLVLSLMIAWFGVNHPRFGREASDSRALEGLPSMSGPQLVAAMHYLAHRLDAERIVFAWSDMEEPWLNVWDMRDGAVDKVQLGPDEFPAIVSGDLADRPFLFDLQRGQVLAMWRGHRQLLAVAEPVKRAFAARFAIDSGLSIPIRTNGYRGQLFALGVPGLCSDHLKLASDVGEEVSSAFERSAMSLATEEAAVTRARLRLARDLHDSIVQFLAGMALKLRALSKNLPDSASRSEIDELQQQLAQEQRDLRRLIAEQRDPHHAASEADLERAVLLLADRLERQWGVACEVSVDPPSLQTPRALQHDLEQLIREAVANAVRHGGAERITIRLAGSGEALELTVADNGKGFPAVGEFADADLRERRIGPRSFHERVQALGGTMTLASSRQHGATLAVSLPTGGAAS